MTDMLTAAPLPRVLLLAYVTGNSAPRVRTFISWGLRTAALLHALAALLLARPFLTDVIDGLATSPSRFARYFLASSLYNDGLPLLLAACLLTMALLQALLAAPASRGRPAPALLTLASLLPVTIALIYAAATAGADALIHIFYYAYPSTSDLVALLIVLLAALAVLLLKDLAAFILWAFRFPSVEKPLTPFLPGNARVHVPAIPPPPAALSLLQEAPALATLPHAHILSYVSTTPTPTHVRNLSAATLVWFSWLHLAAAAAFLTLIAYDTTHGYYGYSIFSGVISLLERLDILLTFLRDQDLLPTAAFLLTLPTAIAARALVIPVRRGRTWACVMAIFLIAPILLLTLLAAALVGCFSLGNAFGWLSNRPHPLAALYLLLLPLLTLWIVLLKDLLTFLTWIAKNPTTEKTPVPFLPT